MSKKVHKLTVNDKFDFRLIGISSHENDYRLTWAINNKLNFKFTRDEDHVIKNKDNVQSFSLFSDIQDEYDIRYYLVSNLCDNGFLISEMRNFDFFMIIQGKVSDHHYKQFIEKLKKIDIIITATNIDPSRLKSKNQLLIG